MITNLGRAGWPAIRYRTGDIVVVGTRACGCGRTFEIEEFRMVRTRDGVMDELTVEVETDATTVADTLGRAFRDQLSVRIPTRGVPAGSLPRWELKAKRVVDARLSHPTRPAQAMVLADKLCRMPWN